MRRYPLWKHVLVCVFLVLAVIYALPSLYANDPSLVLRFKSNDDLLGAKAAITSTLINANISTKNVFDNEKQMVITFNDAQQQLDALTVVQQEVGNLAVVALSSRSSAPAWLDSLGASAITLGLDLRGGVHFLLEVDTDFAIERFYDSAVESIETALRKEKIRNTIERNPTGFTIKLNDEDRVNDALDTIANTDSRIEATVANDTIEATLNGFAQEQVIDLAVGQNIETLRRRVDELGVAEPNIARQGKDRIVVQLPGLQDTARAKAIIGRRAALEMRGVNERASNSPTALARARAGNPPPGTQLLPYSNNQGAILVEKNIVLTGENIVDASYGSDEAGRPAVHLTLDPVGANKIKTYTRTRTGEQLAIILIDKGSTEVISAPNIQSELHARFLIHGGGMGAEEANELALLLRSGSLATPIEIAEERAIGPSLGAENINNGLNAVTSGFILVAILIAIYYGAFGVISVTALLANLICLTALLAVLGANLTLPGLAGFALTLGMAIDANVLINERIREELLDGQTPGLAIEAGYSRAFATILDANITTLIAGLALFALGSGPVRGFAVVLCLGIVTSMFSAIMISRAIADLVYGSRGRLKKISIG